MKYTRSILGGNSLTPASGTVWRPPSRRPRAASAVLRAIDYPAILRAFGFAAVRFGRAAATPSDPFDEAEALNAVMVNNPFSDFTFRDFGLTVSGNLKHRKAGAPLNSRMCTK